VSKKVLDRLSAQLGAKILAATSALGDDEALVAPKDWLEAARFLRDDPELAMDHFVDITAIDYPLRSEAGPLPRFDVVLLLRSMKHNHRIRLKTRVAEGESVPTLVDVWAGTNWGEREIWDMFGIVFENHPDPRRIMLYEEFVGHPLRKDYPIQQTQPLIPYREVEGTDKLPPFGADEGSPFSRIDWPERLDQHDFQVSPAIALQQHQRPTLSQGIEYTDLDDEAVRTAKD
jgi:NADH-quinone oxidoreductase subunit C